MVKILTGPSNFWRCPSCSAILQKRGSPGFSAGARVTGMVTCGGCHRTYPYDAVYGGRYDMPEVELNCPNCSIQLRGPKGDLLGKPCPSCNRTLPYGSKKTVWIVLVVIVASILLIVLSR